MDGGDDLAEGGIAGAFAEAVDGDMDAVDAGLGGGEAVGGTEAVVVVAMEVEADGGEGGDHPFEVAGQLLGGEDAEGVGQHDAGDRQGQQALGEGEDVGQAVAHAVGPVLEVDVDGEALGGGGLDLGLDVVEVLFRGLAQLHTAMGLGALGEQVHDLAADAGDPVGGLALVGEAEDFDGLELAAFGGPVEDGAGALGLACGDARGGDLEAVDAAFVDQGAGDLQLLRRGEGDARRLFAIAQGGVDDLQVGVLGRVHDGASLQRGDVPGRQRKEP